MLAFVVAGFGVSWGQAPATTTISDVVYRADGNLAGGNAADFLADIQHGQRAVGRGRTKERGPCLRWVLTVALVPHTGSTPAGTFYTVVYQLDDGTVKPNFGL